MGTLKNTLSWQKNHTAESKGFGYLRTAAPAITKGGSISADRKRTNILRGPEQAMILFLCKILPDFITPNILTAIGLAGSMMVGVGFVLAKGDVRWLYFSILGWGVQWFGDSLDGRVAYYRNTPRKWFGFSLDMSMDWLSTAFTGIGFYYYLPEQYKILAVLFIVFFGAAMVLALLKYQVTGKYAIDEGLVGPTELRLGICGVMLLEIFFPGSILIVGAVLVSVIAVVDVITFRQVQSLADKRDKTEALTKHVE